MISRAHAVGAVAAATAALLGAHAPAAPAAGAQLGTLVIPKLSVKEPIYESTSARVLARGLGHYPETRKPGQRGTVAIAGHRVTYRRPFRHLDRLGRNDVILIRTRGGRTVRYRVYAMRVVRPHEVWVLRGRQANRLVLTTCHPAGLATRRLVVFAKEIARAKVARPVVFHRGR